jgi:hypothetical protein
MTNKLINKQTAPITTLIMETESIPETSDLNHPKHLSDTDEILLNPVAVKAWTHTHTHTHTHTELKTRRNMWLATRYGLDGPGIEFRRGEIFLARPDRPWGEALTTHPI